MRSNRLYHPAFDIEGLTKQIFLYLKSAYHTLSHRLAKLFPFTEKYPSKGARSRKNGGPKPATIVITVVDVVATVVRAIRYTIRRGPVVVVEHPRGRGKQTTTPLLTMIQPIPTFTWEPVDDLY